MVTGQEPAGKAGWCLLTLSAPPKMLCGTMRAPIRRHTLRSAAASLAVLSAVRCAASDGGPAGVRFVDPTIGFAVLVPAGWRYDRALFAGPGGSLGVLRGVAPDGRATMQILIFRDVARPLRTWIDDFTRNIGKIAGVDRIAVVGLPQQQPPAAYLVVDAHTPRVRSQTLYYCRQFDPRTIFVYAHTSVTGPASAPLPKAPRAADEIPTAFRTLVSSLEVLYNPQVAELIRAARLRGRALLSAGRWSAAVRSLRVDPAAHTYVIERSGRRTGYLTRRFARERHGLDQQSAADGKEGLRVYERLWWFDADGAARWQQIDLFSSLDGQTDLYEITETTIPPPKTSDRPQVVREQCVRQGATLVWTASRDGAPVPPRLPLKLPPDYLGLAWVRLAPALIGPTAREPVGFVIYDTSTRALVPQVFIPRGPGASQPDDGPRFAFDVREGFSPQVARLIVDRWGRMIEYRAAGLTIREAPSEQIEQWFGARRRAALERLRAAERRPRSGP